MEVGRGSALISIPRRVPRGRGLLLVAVVLGPSFLMAPAAANTGGPDAYGYIWVDSRPPSPSIAYSWIDGVSGGARLTLDDDDCTFELEFGFQFRYYGTIMTYAFICSNGFLTFGVPDSYDPTGSIPNASAPNDRVVGLGIDLNPNATGTGGVYIKSQPFTSPKRFIVTWNGVYKFGTTTPETFQIVLEQNQTTKDGRILFQYQSVADVASALVGIENRTGSSGLAYPGPLGNGLAVAFLPPTDAGIPPDGLRATTSDVPRARLWLDDGDGTFLPGVDLEVASIEFAGVPALARLEPASALRVTLFAPVGVYVTYDIAATAGVGNWVGARLPDDSFLSVVFPDRVNAGDFPIETYAADVRTRIDASQDTLILSELTSRMPANVSQWETDVPALSLRLAANQNFVELAGLSVALGGNATATDLWALKALRDVNSDGSFTPGVDDVLATAAPSGSPPTAFLSLNVTLGADAQMEILLLADVSPDAVPGNILNLTINATDVRLPPGSVDSVSPVNFPAATGERTIIAGVRPILRSPWISRLVAPDGIWRQGEYLLGPNNARALLRPAGNRVPGYMVVENNGTDLFVAVDAFLDAAVDPGDGLALVFDTDRDGVPTPGADDAFVANETGGGDFRFNATSGNWTAFATCTQLTAPGCGIGFGTTPLAPIAHRFYEFAIPLATLGLAAGDLVHFALAGELPAGVRDAGGRSTWPLLFGTTMPSLAHSGALLLSPGPLPNRGPSLDWTGDSGHETDGDDPDTGPDGLSFRFRVLYADPDDDPPSIVDPRLHVLENGTDVGGSPFSMISVDPGGEIYIVGAPPHLHP